MNKIIENLKSGNYEVVDNQGVSVTSHFVECLEKEFSDLEEALELACEELGKVEVFDKEFMECESFYDYFKTKAKEMIKSE